MVITLAKSILDIYIFRAICYSYRNKKYVEGDAMILIAYGILLVVYWNCPQYLKAVACVLNFFVGDPIPYVDEMIMVAGLLAKEN